jgi:hypothetical protein
LLRNWNRLGLGPRDGLGCCPRLAILNCLDRLPLCLGSSFGTRAASEIEIRSASTARSRSGMPFSRTVLAVSIVRGLRPTGSAAFAAALPLAEPFPALPAPCRLAASRDSSFVSLAPNFMPWRVVGHSVM